MKLLVIVLVLLGRRQSSAAAEFQVEALSEMKQLMDNNVVLDDWKENQMSPCYWDHVTGEDNKVTTINLASSGLRGVLSPSIAKITTLQHLLFDSNSITGGIPQEFHNLSCLTTLQLGRNNLNGSIPNSLGSLLKLQNLSLEENYIFGEIPPELGNLSSLVNLNLGRNDLSGSIPDFLGNLKKLQELDLRGNRLTGNIPSTLAGLRSLNYINLAYNNLFGEIPVQLLHVAQYDFTGNSLLNCGNQSIPCAKPNPNAGRSGKGWVIPIVIPLVVALICFILFLGCIRRKRKGSVS